MPGLFRTKIRANNRLLELIGLDVARRYPRETGGLLIGYWIGPREAVLTNIVGSGPKAEHRAESFLPDTAWQRKQLAQIYRKSGRTETYLGDWHSHPNGRPIPSQQDKQTARDISEYSDARCPRPLMLIVGFDGHDFQLGPYVWSIIGLRRFNLITKDSILR